MEGDGGRESIFMLVQASQLNPPPPTLAPIRPSITYLRPELQKSILFTAAAAMMPQRLSLVKRVNVVRAVPEWGGLT